MIIARSTSEGSGNLGQLQEFKSPFTAMVLYCSSSYISSQDEAANDDIRRSRLACQPRVRPTVHELIE